MSIDKTARKFDTTGSRLTSIPIRRQIPPMDDKAFWLVVRRGLAQVIRAIDRRYGLPTESVDES